MWAAVVAVPGIADRDLSLLRRISWGAAPASTTLLRDADRHLPAGGGRHRVRPDRVQPGHLLAARRGLDPQDRLGRHADAQRRGTGRRPVDERRPARRGGRDRLPQPDGDEGVLEQARGDRGGIPRRLVPLRRPRASGRRRLLLRRRPLEGHDHLGRREHLLRRGRGRARRASQGGRGRADRRPRHEVRRGAAGRRRPARPGRPADVGRARRVVPGEAGPLQEPARVLDRRRTPPQPERQGAQDRAAPGALRRLTGRPPPSELAS